MDEKHDNETPVIFRKYPDGDIIALFPTEVGGQFGECQDYLHIGQHGSADYGHVIRHSKPAKPEEYAELLSELVQIGHDDLKVYGREQQWMRNARIQSFWVIGLRFGEQSEA